MGLLSRTLKELLDAGKMAGKVVQYPDEWIGQVPTELRKEVAKHNEGLLGSVYREGFNESPVRYHGTDRDFSAFDKAKTGGKTDSGMFGDGFYFTDEPAYASTYASNRSGGNVIPAKVNINNPYIINSRTDIPDIDIPSDSIDDLLNADSLYSKAFREHLEGMGHDGVVDNIGSVNQVVAFNPNQIRSVNAVLDPAKSGSSNILASRVAPTATAGLLGLTALAQSDESEAAVLGKSIKFIDDAIKSGKHFLYHSGDASIAKDLHEYGIEPQHGEWVRETLAHAIDEPEDYLEGTPAAAWFSDAPDWVKGKASRAANKPVSEMTEADIEKYGHLSIIDPKATWDEGAEFWRVPSTGISEGEHTEITNLLGDTERLHSTSLYEYDDMLGRGKYTHGLESGDIVTTETIEPTTTLTGRDLVDFLKVHNPSQLKSALAPTATAGLLGLSALAPDDARAAEIAATDMRDVGSIQAANHPKLQALAGLLGSIDTPIGKPFESIPNSLLAMAYGDDPDLLRSFLSATDIAP